MKYLVLFFCSSLVSVNLFAQSSWQRVMPLQFHCGVQPRAMASALVYGNLVFQDSEGRILVAFFNGESANGAPHSYCPLLSDSLLLGRDLRVKIENSGSFLRLTGLEPL